MKIAIVDNQKDALITTKKRLRNLELDFIEVFSFLSINEMEELDIQFDLIFLDIDMLEINGLEYARNNRDKKIIFVTRQKEYMKKAYGPNVYGFIEKDESDIEFKETIIQALNEISKERYIVLKLKNGVKKFFIEKIIYLQYIGNRHIGFVYDCKSYVALGVCLKDLEMLLGKQFIYIDRSTLVNIKKIIGVVDEKLLLMDISTKFNVSYKRVKKIKSLIK